MLEKDKSREELFRELEGLLREKDFAEHIFAAAPLLIFGLSPDGQIIFVNQAGTSNTHYSSQDLIGRNWFHLFFPGPQFAQIPPFLAQVRQQQVANHPMNWTVNGGEIRTISWNTANRYRADGQLAEIICIGTDTTENRKNLDELKKSKERYRRLVESVNSYDYSVQIENGVARETTYSANCLSVTGYSPDDYKNDPDLWFKMVHADDKAKVLQHARDMLTTGPVGPIEHRIIKKNGELRWIRNTPVALRDSHDQIKLFDGLIVDITERKLAELEVTKLNEDLERRVILRTIQLESLNRQLQDVTGLQQAILDSAKYLILSTDGEGIIQTFNLSARQHLGYKTTEVIGKVSPLTFIMSLEIEQQLELARSNPGQDLHIPTDILFSRARSGQADEREWTLVRKDGTTFPAHLSIVGLQDPKGQINGFLLIGTDITERKKLDELKIMSEARLKALLALNLMSGTCEKDLITFALEEGIRLTRSKIGYVGFLKRDETVFSMHSWSKTAMEDCHMENRLFEFEVKDLKLLGDPVRERRPIITNHDPQKPDQMRTPEGHTPIRNHMSVPIFDDDRIVIIIGVANKEDSYEQSDADQLTLLMSGVWQILQKHRLENELKIVRETELQIASQIQQTLLMGKVPCKIPRVKIAATSIPSQVIDGDFFDFYQHDRHCFDLLIGDVMGKGVAAALVGAAAKSQFQRALARLIAFAGPGRFPDPEEILARVHADMTPTLAKLESFLCMHFARFDLQRLQMSVINCGHTHLIHYRSSLEACVTIAGENMPLGLNEKETYRQVLVPLEPGDIIFFYSDGATEARNANHEFFGLNRIMDLITANHDAKPGDIIRKITRAVNTFIGSERLADDLTFVAVSVDPIRKCA